MMYAVMKTTVEGKVLVLEGCYTDKADALEVVEALCWLHDENDYEVVEVEG